MAKKVLSKNSPDLAIRLGAIKTKYEQLHLETKLQSKLSKELSWFPDWKHPKVQVVNDSVSYVFYKLIGRLERNGKKETVKELNGATYLMVKNENEFYRAFYFKKGESADSDKAVPSEIKIEYFTGKLLLSNLEKGEKFLLDYNNGSVNSSNQKNSLSPVNKLQTIRGTLSYYETQCHTEVRSCQFTGSGYSDCGGNIIVVYSQTCQWPQPFCGVTFSLTDYNEEQVCEDIWFPDPPTDPENPGGSGGYDDGGTIDTINHVVNPCLRGGLAKAMQADCENNIKALMASTYLGSTSPDIDFYDSAMTPADSNTYAVTRVNNLASLNVSITLNTTNLPSTSEEFIVSTIYHEVLHAYFTALFPPNQPNGTIIIPDDHMYMATNYIEMMTNSLTYMYPGMSRADATALSWGGLEKTSAWNLLTAAQKDEIVSINRKYSGKNAQVKQGQYCN
nr:hypothetical protein [Pedobacter sp. ASV2]